MSNIKLTKNRILYASKHLYECSNEMVKMRPTNQTDDRSLFQIKEKNH